MTHELSCKELVDLVADYLEETISEEARQQFEQHLGECGYCSTYVQQMHLTVKLTHQLAEPETEVQKPAPDELMTLFRKWKQDQK